jgi:hypothetical protein
MKTHKCASTTIQVWTGSIKDALLVIVNCERIAFLYGESSPFKLTNMLVGSRQ